MDRFEHRLLRQPLVVAIVGPQARTQAGQAFSSGLRYKPMWLVPKANIV
jgi:hypothetical protein